MTCIPVLALAKELVNYIIHLTSKINLKGKVMKETQKKPYELIRAHNALRLVN